MAKTKAPADVPALKLNLGGAPANWHTIADLLGFYHPDIPTPVGGPGECPLDVAQDASAHEGSPVELVYITEAEAEESRRIIGEELMAVANVLRDDPDATQQQIDNTVDALAGPGAASSTSTDDTEEA